MQPMVQSIDSKIKLRVIHPIGLTADKASSLTHPSLSSVGSTAFVSAANYHCMLASESTSVQWRTSLMRRWKRSVVLLLLLEGLGN